MALYKHQPCLHQMDDAVFDIDTGRASPRHFLAFTGAWDVITR